MKQFFDRLFSKTPSFFVVIRNFGLSVTALATFVLTLQSNGVAVPEWIANVFGVYTVCSGATASFEAQLTKICTIRDVDDTEVKVNP